MSVPHSIQAYLYLHQFLSPSSLASDRGRELYNKFYLSYNATLFHDVQILLMLSFGHLTYHRACRFALHLHRV